MTDTALFVMLLMWASPLLGQVGGGWALEISKNLEEILYRKIMIAEVPKKFLKIATILILLVKSQQVIFTEAEPQFGLAGAERNIFGSTTTHLRMANFLDGMNVNDLY